jgi:hypothetical protein
MKIPAINTTIIPARMPTPTLGAFFLKVVLKPRDNLFRAFSGLSSDIV